MKTLDIERILTHHSYFLTSRLKKNPEWISQILASPFLTTRKEKQDMMKDLLMIFPSPSSVSFRETQKKLRDYKYFEMGRIIIKDLAGLSPFEDIGYELSALSSSCLEIAQSVVSHLLPWNLPYPRIFTTIGLGKMGGHDLNLSSDIDILYLFDMPNEKILSSHEETEKIFKYYTTCAEMITRLMQERTEDGIIFRVDLELRPRGKSGPIVNSLDSLLTYYEIAGAAWERSVMIKATPVAGDQSLGQKFTKQISPFVYRRSIDTSVIDDLKKMKEKINQEMPPLAEYNVKLGKGGIRELEFFVSAFQLIYGGRELLLRERNTLKALRILKELHLVPGEEALALKESYIFLRRIENRLQMLEERQTHTLPADKKVLLNLAKSMGLLSVDQLLSELHQKTNKISKCFEKLAP